MYPARPVMVAVAMTRYHQERYITQSEGSAASFVYLRSHVLPPWCMADVFRESGTTNKATSLGLSRFSSSQRTSSWTGLGCPFGSLLISLMASGLVRGPGG